MDFFQAQDDARARTRTLVVLFLAAVVGIIVAVYAIVHVTLDWSGYAFSSAALLQLGIGPRLQLLSMVALCTTALIGIGSCLRIIQLRQGGPRVATLLGGTAVSPDSTDEGERRLINVVEEMALASGTPVPAIFVLENEKGINAFAAGYTTGDAAVAVTRGALETLNRDELQGVIAHEFSHILNGDMRLNLRLIGLLYGILLLATIGRGLMRSGGRRRSNSKGSGQAALVGLGLVAVGYIGVFFGRLIQAAASRQREYLADASAVQFTRNPGGIASALRKIGTEGSRIENHHAQEASHLFFASGVKQRMTSLFATHPPLTDRIRRIDSSFKGLLAAEGYAGNAANAAMGVSAPALSQLAVSGLARRAGTAALMDSIGSPRPEHVAYAAELLRTLPAGVRAAAHDPDGAAALVFALLLHDGGSPAAAQQDALTAHGGAALASRVATLAREVASLGAGARLPLLDLTLPALRRIMPAESRRLVETAQALIAADGRTDAFEFALLHLLRRRLEGGARRVVAGAEARTVHSIETLRSEVECVMSAVAWAGAADATAAARAFAAGVAALPQALAGITLRPRDAVSMQDLDAALGKLRFARPGIRRALLEACTHGVAAADARVDVQEATLLRAVAEALDCPMPPVIAGALGEPVRRGEAQAAQRR